MTAHRNGPEMSQWAVFSQPMDLPLPESVQITIEYDGKMVLPGSFQERAHCQLGMPEFDYSFLVDLDDVHCELGVASTNSGAEHS